MIALTSPKTISDVVVDMNVTAVLSMLHEPAAGNSATRRFRGQPVLGWTLDRLSLSEQLGTITVICWEDQLEEVGPIAQDSDSHVLAKGPRTSTGLIEAITAARRWGDGWRGGPLSTCDFDLGFHGEWILEVIGRLSSDAVLLVDPSAALVDPKIIDDLILHAHERPNLEICFTQAAPGLGGVFLRPKLIQRLAAAKTHPGRLLHYLPDQPMRDPIGGDGCVAVPAAVARTTRSFRLDSERQIHRVAHATVPLNGELVATDAEDLIHRCNWTAEIDPLPREIVLEINTNRATSPVFWPGKYQAINRPPLSCDLARELFGQLRQGDDVRVTLGGIGDPLLHPELFQLLQIAAESGIRAVHVETDLVADAQIIERIADSPIDIVSVHLPAMSQATYAAIMGVDRFQEVIENIRRFVARRQQIGRATPLIVPTFVKCQQNLVEMELWYDQWLKAIGAAVIRGPSDFGGMIPDCSVADMSPAKRAGCRRISSRMTILSDGRVVSCEQDVLARQVIGDAADELLPEIWHRGFMKMRECHRAGEWGSMPICAACREWHRP